MVEALYQSIRAAFPEHVPPRAITGHQCPECDEIDSLLGGRLWTEIAANFPDFCHDAFPLLSPIAQAYYLPAYMVAALGPECGLQGHSLESALTPGGLLREALTLLQRAAVLEWARAYYQQVDAADPPPEFVEYWHGELPV